MVNYSPLIYKYHGTPFGNCNLKRDTSIISNAKVKYIKINWNTWIVKILIHTAIMVRILGVPGIPGIISIGC